MLDYQRWCGGLSKDGEATGTRPNDAAQRLTAGSPIDLLLTPKFAFGADDRFFCIGSCFAREIEKALVQEGRTVLSMGLDPAAHGLTIDDFPHHLFPPVGLATQFNTYTMVDVLQRAHDRTEVTSADFYDVNGEFWDASLHHAPLASLDKVTSIRRMVDASYARLRDARVIVITLGLTELWWDVERDRAINTPPPNWPSLKRQGAIEYRNTSYAEASANVARMIELAGALASDAKIVFTVSPVPLHRTFSDQDIVIANTYSKSLLRTVAQEAAAAHESVEYFPSYEFVSFSPRDVAWMDDQRHVKSSMVRWITSRFVNAYLPQQAASS